MSLKKIKRVEVTKKKEQAHFVLGFMGTTFHQKDRYAMEVLDAILSGQGGRLFYQLRDKESLAYALTFMAYPNLDSGFLGIYMGTHPDKLEKAIRRVLEELKKIKEEGFTEDEVARARKFLVGNYEIGLQTNGAQAGQISFDELYGLGYDHFKNYPREIEKVSKEEVFRVVQKYIHLDAYALAIIRPPTGKEE
jgi:zinc protease